MNAPDLFRTLARTFGVTFLLLAAPVFAQTAGTGTITGRVLEVSNGRYLANARVSVEGSTLQTFTDAAGQFLLAGVPAGEASIRVFYTGLPAETQRVVVSAGGTTPRNFALAPAGQSPAAAGAIVKLDAFVVDAERTMDQQSIAINEQRSSATPKTVVSTDQFGDVSEGNVSEFMKFMPGVAVEYGESPDATQILLRGVNPAYTAVNIDGNQVAGAASSGASRAFDTQQVSINNVSRIEVAFSRTPDMPAAALGGSVNMISRYAFDRATPEFSYRAYFAINSMAREVHRTPGPATGPSYKIKPGVDFSYTNAVNKKFGFTLSYLKSDNFAVQNVSVMNWTPGASGAGSDFTNPFMKTWNILDGPTLIERQSLGVTFDFRLTERDTFSVRPKLSYFDQYLRNRRFTFNVQGTANTTPVAWSDDFVTSAAGAGDAIMATTTRHKYGNTFQLDTAYRHTGPLWTLNAATSFSRATNHYKDMADGYFNGSTLRRNRLTVGFGGIASSDAHFKPAVFNVTDTTTGAAFDYSDVGNYYIDTVTSVAPDSQDVFRSAQLDAARKLSLAAPTTIKVGILLQDRTRDIRNPSNTYTFVGPNKVATAVATPDADNLARLYPVVYDTKFTSPPPFNFTPMKWVSPDGLYQLYKDHPEYFTASQSNAAVAIQNSRYLSELITAAYLQGDSRFLKNRLRLVYGIRFERTRDIGDGYLRDINKIYQRDAAGKLVLSSTGRPIVLTAPNGLLYTDASNVAVRDQLIFKERGLRNRVQYGAGYPSVNASFELTPNLLARFAYTRALGRPDLSNIIPATNLPDRGGSTPYAITVVNSALAPQQADNFDVTLEYYFARVGSVTVSAFRKDFSNFFGTKTVNATAELLAQYNVPEPDYYLQNNGTLTSNFNVGRGHLTGVQLDYKQVLDFLPVAGFSVFSTGYLNHLVAPEYADFRPFVAKSFSAGLAYDRRRLSAKLNFNYRGTERMAPTTVTDSKGSTAVMYQYFREMPTFDLNLNFRLTRRLGVFFNDRNVLNRPNDLMRYAPNTPSYAKMLERLVNGARITIGVKGSF